MKRAAQKPFNLILLGDPASGKGTQAARLIKKYHFYDLDMGREIRKPSVRARFDYENTSAIGHLTPTAVVRGIFKEVIHSVPSRYGILFNGTPKMINEAKLVSRLLKESERSEPFVIYLSISTNEIVRRMKKRVEKMGRVLVKRDDDTERALRNRQKYYKEQISRVVAFFGERYTVKKISGMGTEAAVAKKIEAAVRHYIAVTKQI
ncbi:MAG TPA: nucleoside monophosphate kinase [Candidatus Paceibacterota bacterium]|nr:nucleoside monophosphate kinase [Candidatus Paceibacterota bacterium]